MNLCWRSSTLFFVLAVLITSGVCWGQSARKDKDKEIYDERTDARAEIKEALAKAKAEHKRVIVVFGANWCFDCHVLDKAFHSSGLAPIVTANYEVVHVDIGKGEKNQDLMTKYEVPMKRGIPGLAVLEGDGKLVFSQKNGEFENARALSPDDFLAFLNKWKPPSQ
jgi:thioredoxin 1